MAISQQTLISTYTANGSTSIFPFAFKIFNESQVKVIVDGLNITTGFTIDFDPEVVGGSVVFLEPPVNGTSVRILRSTALVRTTDFVTASTLDANVLDLDLDYLTSIVQENSSYGIQLNNTGTWDANNFEMVNVGYPYGANSAISRSYLDSTLINTGNVPTITLSDNNKFIRLIAGVPTWHTLNVVTELGYTPFNKSGDTVSGNLTVSGTTTLNSTLTSTSDISAVNITASGAITSGGIATQKIVLSTTQTLSGTSADFLNIPSWVKKITVTFSSLSFNAADDLWIQLGTASGLTTTGYVGWSNLVQGGVSSIYIIGTGGMVLGVVSANNIITGTITITSIGNKWIGSHIFNHDASQGYSGYGASSVTLPDVLTRLRLTGSAGGSFDGGSVNILYEGY